jgi:hypothetical protein
MAHAHAAPGTVAPNGATAAPELITVALKRLLLL